MNQKRVAYYIRTSTKSESQLTSIENQPKYFQSYIAQQKEDGNNITYTPVTTYVDWGVSGTSVSRRHFLYMLKDCGIETYIQYTDKSGKKIDRQIILPPRDNDDSPFYDNKYIQSRENIYFKPPIKSCVPPFDEIWCKTTSRFGRSIFQLMDIVEYLNQQNVFVRFVEQNLFSGNPKDMPIIASAFILDSNYSEKLSSDGQASRLMKASEGKLIGSANILGFNYQPVKRDGHRVIAEAKYIHNKDSDLVKMLFKTYSETKSLTKTSKLILKDGKPFPISSLKKIIDNPVYAGINSSLRYTKSSKSKKLHNELFNPNLDNPKYELSKHIDAIITPELYFECQKIKSENTIRIQDKNIGRNSEHDPFIHKIKCGYCGNHFQFDNNKGNSFYICKTKNDNGYGVYNLDVLDYHLQKCNVVNIYKIEFLEYLKNLSEGGLYSNIQLSLYNTLDEICYNIDNYFINIDSNFDNKIKHLDSNISKLENELVIKYNDLTKATSEKLKTLINNSVFELDNRIKVLLDQKTELIAMVDENYIKNELEKLMKVINSLKQHQKVVSIDELWDYVDYINVYGYGNPLGGYHKTSYILTPKLKNFNNYKTTSIKSNYFINKVYIAEFKEKGFDLIRMLEFYYKRQKGLLDKK